MTMVPSTAGWPGVAARVVLLLVGWLLIGNGAALASGRPGEVSPDADRSSLPIARNPLAGFGHGLSDAMRAGEKSPGRFEDLGPYDPQVLPPEEHLGFPLGARPAVHREVYDYCRHLAERSDRVRLLPYGWTHEGRRLFALLVGTADRVGDAEALREDLARWADPRTQAQPDPAGLPVCVWVGACVHGNEPSGTDAALELAYQLVASQAAAADRLRENLIVLIDPLQNPDGRDRVLAQWRSLAAYEPDADDQSLRQWGVWPGGRTNHYLFDLNRDWFYVTQPESQGRTAFVTRWHPHVMIDAHEMGGQDTYLFSPPREPFHAAVSEYHHRWWDVFAADQAAAFDQRRWDYYVGDWHEEWFPGFASSWSAGIGAIGILYEQASARGSRVARRDGTLMTYRDTVEHQYVSYWANLETAARKRLELLRAYREQIESNTNRKGAYLFDTSGQPGRAASLARALSRQGVEIYVTTEEMRTTQAKPFWTDERQTVLLPPGALVVPLGQPHGALAEVVLAFDPAMEEDFLRSQRRELEKKGRSRFYDVTSWTLAIASGLPAYEITQAPQVELRPLGAAFDGSPGQGHGLPGETSDLSGQGHGLPGETGRLLEDACRSREDRGACLGYLIDGADDRVLWTLVRLWEAGLKVHGAREPFTHGGRAYPRGSLLIKRAAQGPSNGTAPGLRNGVAQGLGYEGATEQRTVEAILAEIAQETGVTIRGVPTALTEAGPDLGGHDFRPLTEPKIAVLAAGNVSWSEYGAIAWVLDVRAGVPFTPLAVDALGEVSLARYDVLVMPDYWGGPAGLKAALGPAGESKLRDWIRDGGTLVACGDGAAYAADSSSGLGSVRLRRDALSRIASRTKAALERAGIEPGEAGVLRRAPAPGTLNEDDFALAELDWAKTPGVMDGRLPGGYDGLVRPEPLWPWGVGRQAEALAVEDERMRRFHPRGCILRVELDPEAWLTAGCAVGPVTRTEAIVAEWMAAQVRTDYALVATDPRTVAASFATEDSLRLSGLLWPEGRQRWAQTAYLTREGVGKGQVILFVATPCHRGVWKSAERAFLNAVLLGPGMGGPPAEPYE